jgi:hypothetical protein
MKTTQLTVDNKAFYRLTEDSLRLGAVRVGGKTYLFPPVCLETAERAAGCPDVALLHNETRSATPAEEMFLRGMSPNIDGVAAGGFE